jgi:enamine deaminase RidA (YjgF/YER057c/UK114 family)
MNNHKIYQNKFYTIYTSIVGADQFYLIASVKDQDADPIETCREIYIQIAAIIKQMEIQIFRENIFGSISIQKDIIKAREDILRDFGFYEELPITYIQGNPIWGKGFSGLQIFAVKLSQPDDKIWTVYEDGVPFGRVINRNGATILSLQNIHGLSENNLNNNSYTNQTYQMFDQTNRLLSKYGADYHDVVCTRIYISDILDWYNEFNRVRNAKYTEFGILPEKSENLIMEEIYLPSSTGIQADNPDGTTAVMNILAVAKGSNTQFKIRHNNGTKQRSAYGYGSAFSRSTIICEPNSKHILVSGTASIDEHGKSLYPGNPREQIRKTLEIVDTLLSKEGASLKDICHATVFLKRQKDISIYHEVANEFKLADMPAVCIIADVCRDELLFELDAIAAVEFTN